jgi:signal transduction histidine kinase
MALEPSMNDGIILCVDDDPTVLAALRVVLGKLGPDYTVEIAEGGEEALEIEHDLRQQGRRLAVIISDFIMPGMRGDELLVRLHALSPNTVKIMLTGQSDFEGVKTAINKANLYRFLEKPFNNDDIFLTVKSATEAFNHERELTCKNEELTRLNTELEATLERLNNQSETLTRSEAKATISTLVASVSHELGTPLGNSVMTADMLADLTVHIQKGFESGQIKRSDLDSYIHSVSNGIELLQKNLQRANGLLQNFKQVAADQASEQQRDFELGPTVTEILATLAPSLRSKPYRIVLDIAVGIWMDSLPGALGQVVINLVNNAYVHAFEGRDQGVLNISAKQDGDQVRICFADNGVGMSKEDLERLMEPFFSTKIGRGGTGLGMSIVDNLVCKTMGGTIEVNSTVGVGTSFLISLPCILLHSAAI